MTVLNLTNDGLPNLLVLLQSALIRAGGRMGRDELLQTVAPPGVVEDEGGLARATLNRWTTLGLFQESEGQLQTGTSASDRTPSAADLLPAIRRAACSAALDQANNADFWGVEGSRSADLTRALAWMQLQDPYRLRFGGFESQESRQIDDPDRLLFRNPTRVAGLRVWASFLGFSREPFGDIDPTVAVRDALPEVLQPGQGMAARRFVAAMTGLLPVLDGGRYQQQVVAGLRAGVIPPLAEGQVSAALSRALLCLRAGGDLLLGRKDDIGSAITLTGRDGTRSDLTFHWVERPATGRKSA